MKKGFVLMGGLLAAALLMGAATSPGWAADEKKDEAKNEGNIFGPGSRLKISGRAGVIYQTGQDSAGLQGTAGLQGANQGSFAIPEAKIAFDYAITENVAGRLRLTLNNGAAITADRYFIDVKNLFGQNWLSLRTGLHPIIFGEEWDKNNIVHQYGVTNTSENVSGTDEGLILMGKHTWENLRPFGAPIQFTWDAGVYNGEGAVNADQTSDKAWSGRLGFKLSDGIFASGSYFNSGDIPSLGATNLTSPLAFAGYTAAPGGAAGQVWNRNMWEADAQWRFNLSGNPDALKKAPRWSDPYDPMGAQAHTGMVRGTYGQFEDEENGAAPVSGNYYAVEGMYNIGAKWYLGGKWSVTDVEESRNINMNRLNLSKLANGAWTTTWNTPASNEYRRGAVYGAYNLTNRTNVKAEYVINDVVRADGTEERDNDYFVTAITTVF